MPSVLLLALVLGLAPVGEAPVDLQPPLDADVGPVDVDLGEGQVAVEAPLVGPVLLQACEGCPLVETGPAARTAPDSAAPRPSWSPADLTPPQAVAATSISAVLLGALAWVLPRLAAALPFVGFSRIDDDALARHPARQLALQFITANPGANIQDVRRALGLAWGTTVYHLTRLERGGLVAVRRIAGERRHWPLGTAPARDALPPTGQALATLVGKHPGLAQAELARMLGLGAPAACKQLARLEEAGLVEARRDGHSRRYVATQRLAALLADAAAAPRPAALPIAVAA